MKSKGEYSVLASQTTIVATPIVDIAAPETMPAGYTFNAEHQGRIFSATVVSLTRVNYASTHQKILALSCSDDHTCTAFAFTMKPRPQKIASRPIIFMAFILNSK